MSGTLQVRRPRSRLVVNGTPINGCRSAEVVSSRMAQAASFRVVASSTDMARALGLGWTERDALDVAVEFGFAESHGPQTVNWQTMISGRVDRISLDQATGLVSLDGRDYAARLIDLVVQDGYMNKTSSEIAQDLAMRCGLSVEIDPTAQLVGQYYQIEHAKNALAGFSRHGNGWDLLAELADLEGFELWVADETLHFKQPMAASSALFDVVYSPPGLQVGSPGLTISHLSMERSLGLSGPLQVKVTSWNNRQRKQVTGLFPATAGDGTRQFLIVKPNLLPDEADVAARNIFNRLVAHQYVVSGRMAGELALTTQHRLRLSGTGTGWDRTYTIDRIEREMSLHGGFVQHVTARSDTSGGAVNG